MSTKKMAVKIKVNTNRVSSFCFCYILAKYYINIGYNILPGGLQDVKETGYDV